jgi:hypothetical protein
MTLLLSLPGEAEWLILFILIILLFSPIFGLIYYAKSRRK